MLSPGKTARFYLDCPLQIPKAWNLGRKHFRVSLGEGRFVKLNRFENRLNNSRDLELYSFRLKLKHVYFSVLNWLFLERIDKKYKARYCVPLHGEYVIDIYACLMLFKNNHKVEEHWFVCGECLGMSKKLRLNFAKSFKNTIQDWRSFLAVAKGSMFTLWASPIMTGPHTEKQIRFGVTMRPGSSSLNC